MIETVEEHCKHPDCRYRKRLTWNGESCQYMLITGKRRGCEISECDKYKKGKLKVVSKIYGFDFEDE